MKASMHSNSPVPPVLTAQQREIALGDDPFTPAYDLIYQLLAAIFMQSGRLQNELIGLEFEHGQPKQASVVNVQDIEHVPVMLDQMLQRWPMVVHAFEAWLAPDRSYPTSEHPLREDIVSLMLHTQDVVAAAICPCDATTKIVHKAELVFPDAIGGRGARKLPVQHQASMRL